MNKRISDTQTGKDRRDRAIEYLNSIFAKRNLAIRFESLAGLGKNHVFSHGLHYSLLNELKRRSINFVIMVVGSGGFYLKIPKSDLSDPKAYLNSLIKHEYHCIIMNQEGSVFSKVFTVKDIDTYWSWDMATSKGNENRMQFKGSMKDVVLLDPFTKTFFHPDLISQLTDLFK